MRRSLLFIFVTGMSLFSGQALALTGQDMVRLGLDVRGHEAHSRWAPNQRELDTRSLA